MNRVKYSVVNDQLPALVFELIDSLEVNRVEVDGEDLQRELKQTVRSLVGPIATPREVLVVGRLPKTRSGKILRGTMRKIADGKDYIIPATIEDPSVLDEIKTAFEV